ncbi:formate dehydrogenase accessory sulfurtransferase FdhD [Agaribacter flavus]|uniref:Formate dehydrogenase accessory sulfurtransferase FdhD n=1 Tax=Agaribacter flavus TaxID=1902781 RepID=A0ABV7FMU7_9ALTE
MHKQKITQASVHHSDASKKANEIALPEEVATAIEINGISFVVMMLTPYDIENFVHGFLFTEGIVDNTYDIHGIELSSSTEGITAHCEVAKRCMQGLQNRLRAMRGAGGCGVCGTQALSQVFPELPRYAASSVAKTISLESNQLRQLRKRVNKFQQRAQNSGAMHAAFWLNTDLDIEYCQEDIGRHNALDKLIGRLRLNNVGAEAGAVLITSRCGAELVHKIARFGTSVLISFASPSDLALKLAKTYNITLIHVPKTDEPRIY